MATTIGAIVTNEIVFDLRDAAGEPGRISLPLKGTMIDADLIATVDDYIALQNALVTPKLVRTYPFVGYATAGRPIAALQSLIASVLALDFQKPNPVNALKTVNRQVLITSYLDALRNDGVSPHVPVTSNATLNALIALLEANIDMVGADGVHYPGGWTYNPSSKFGTKLTVTDGF